MNNIFCLILGHYFHTIKYAHFHIYTSSRCNAAILILTNWMLLGVKYSTSHNNFETLKQKLHKVMLVKTSKPLSPRDHKPHGRYKLN